MRPILNLRPRAVDPIFGHPVLFSRAFQNELPRDLPVRCNVDESGFLDEVDSTIFRFQPTSEVEVRCARGKFIGVAVTGFDTLRFFSRQDEPIDASYFERRVKSAFARRQAMFGDELALTSRRAYRMVAADNDELPFVTIDMYCDVAVLKSPLLQTRFRTWLVDAIRSVTGCVRVVERAADGSGKWLGGDVADGASSVVSIDEHGLEFQVDVINGHKTGFYLDQVRRGSETSFFVDDS